MDRLIIEVIVYKMFISLNISEGQIKLTFASVSINKDLIKAQVAM